MSATPANPYRGFMVNYAPHDSGKDANREDIISYGAAQLLQDRPTEIRYHSDTTQPPFGSPSTFITNHSATRQPGSHYNTHGYRLSPIQGSRKRRTDNEPEANEDTDHNYGYRSILQNLPMGDPSGPGGESTDLSYADHVGPSSSHQTSNQDYLQSALPQQQHHHHRLPSQALVGTTSADQGSEQYLPQIDRSFMNLPGVPTPYPEPKAPKTRFGHKEDEMLIALKEQWKFSWRQIECFFPGRKQQTLQVRYCTKLKERDVVWDDALLGPGIPPAACKLRAEELE